MRLLIRGLSAPILLTLLAAPPQRPALDPARAATAKATLLERGYQMDAERFAGRVRNGDLETVHLYLDAGIDPDSGDRGTPPLLEAAGRGHLAVAQALLVAGADPNKKDDNGVTPLQEAVMRRQPAVVKVLLDAGANPNLAYRHGGESPLMRASGSDLTLMILLDGGADPNRVDDNGSGPLMNEARAGNVETVKALLAKGADPNARAVGGATPLLMAVIGNHLEVVRLLLAAGADARTDREMLNASAQSPEMKKLLANPPNKANKKKGPK